MSVAEQVQKIFDENFNLDHPITRIPAIISTDGNSVTTFDSNLLPDELPLNKPTSGSVRSLTNKIKNDKSAVQRTLIGYVTAARMTQHKTHALQILVLYLNNALIELTNVLGSDIVTDISNKISVSFSEREDCVAIEMQVMLKVNKE